MCQPHFPGIDPINLCDYFVLPEVFYCRERRPFYEVAKSLPPSMVCELKNDQFGTEPERYRLKPSQVKVVEKFHFDQKPACIGGFLGIYPVGGFGLEATMPWKFRKKYVLQIYRLKQKNRLLAKRNNDYAVVHWRRGDQLTSDVRCAKAKNGTHSADSSVNCGSVEMFIEEVRRQVRTLIEIPYKYSSPIPIYIATNENNRTILDRLAKENFILGDHLFGDTREERRESHHHGNNTREISNEAKQMKMKMTTFNSVEKYILELILMCESRFLFIHGETSSNYLAQHCRHVLPMFTSSTSLQKVTFHNGVPLSF
jgi:hypothetical protein